MILISTLILMNTCATSSEERKIICCFNKTRIIIIYLYLHIGRRNYSSEKTYMCGYLKSFLTTYIVVTLH